MDTEDCKENIEFRPLNVNSGGSIAASPASRGAPPLAASYLQPIRVHPQNSPLLNPRQLPPPPHQHFSYSILHMHRCDSNADAQSIPSAGKEHCTYEDDILMGSDDTEEHNMCVKDASTQSPNREHLHLANNMDAGLLKPYASYSAMHLSNNETTPGISAAGMGAPLQSQEIHGVISNHSNTDASTSTTPQPCGIPPMSFTGMDLSLPDNSKKKKGKARKCSFNGDFSAFSSGLSSIALSLATKSGQHQVQGQLNALDRGLRPHIITISRGEDVSVRIASFQLEGNWRICVLSAVGSISNVTLCHSEMAGGTVTYEGCYDILSLSGSLSTVGIEDFQNRAGLIVSLSGLDGRVIGGEVKGMFVAASPIQVVVGTFLSEALGHHVSEREATLQEMSTLEHRLGSAVCDSHRYQHPSHMVTSQFLDLAGTGNAVDAER